MVSHHTSMSNNSTDTHDTVPLDIATPDAAIHELPTFVIGLNRTVNREPVILRTRGHSRQVSYRTLFNKQSRKQEIKNRTHIGALSVPMISFSAPMRPHSPDNVSAETSKSARYQCNRCQKQFKAKWSLHVQQVYVHNKYSQYQCNKCDKCLSSLSRLKTICYFMMELKIISVNIAAHMRIHTGDRPFVCKICDNKFTKRRRLKNHIRIHTGAKPFVCEICDQGFTQSSGLRFHMSHHCHSKLLT